MKGLWYIYSNQVVTGPHSTENVELGLSHQKWAMDSLIWWKGQREWVSVQDWKKNLTSILETFKSNVQKTVWYVEHLGLQKGPMNANELHQYILQNGLLPSCRVWTTGMESWKNLFELPELLDFMGVTRRKHPRAAIKGELQIHIPDKELIFPLGTISEGGVGAKQAVGFTSGSSYDVTVHSPMLVAPVHARGTIVYSNNHGATGIQFQSLPAEAQSTIVDFVKQFCS